MPPRKTTGVQLGLAEYRTDKYDQLGFYDTFLGGQAQYFENETPAKELITCKECNQILTLLIQAYAPLENTKYERLICIFGCTRTECMRKPGTIRVLRGCSETAVVPSEFQEEDYIEKTVQNPFEIGKNIESSTQVQFNPFSKETMVVQQPIFTVDVQEKSVQGNQKSCTPVSDLTSKISYPSWWVIVEPETIPTKSPSSTNIKQIQQLHNIPNESMEWANELYEKTEKDPVFRKFCERVEANPKQCLRYELNGIPLLYSSFDPINGSSIVDEDKHIKKSLIPNCPSCGTSRRFEMQLMPFAVECLEDDMNLKQQIESVLEWGSILVFTCEKDCHSTGTCFLEEFAFIHWEEQVNYKETKNN